MPTYRKDIHLGHDVPLIETDDIKKGAITTDKIADGAITSDKFAPGAITGDKVDVDTVTHGALADDAVWTRNIKDKAVTPSKVSDDFISTLVQPLIDSLQQQIDELRGSIPSKDVLYRCYIYQSLGGIMQEGETETEEVKVFWGTDDVTERFTQISVTRDSGDEVSDAAWNDRHTSVSNPFQISFADLRIDNDRKRTDFYVTAVDPETNQSATRILTFE